MAKRLLWARGSHLKSDQISLAPLPSQFPLSEETLLLWQTLCWGQILSMLRPITLVTVHPTVFTCPKALPESSFSPDKLKSQNADVLLPQRKWDYPISAMKQSQRATNHRKDFSGALPTRWCSLLWRKIGRVMTFSKLSTYFFSFQNKVCRLESH